MTEPDEAFDVEAVLARHSDGWRAESGGETVRGYAGDPCPADARASFSIRRAGGHIWPATWKVSNEARNRDCKLCDRVTGVRERCVEWMAERAAALKESRHG